MAIPDSVMITHLLPGSNLLVVPHARSIRRPPLRDAGDVRRLGYEERPRDGGPLGVVLDPHVGVNAAAVGAASRQRCKHHSVAESDLPDPYRMKECGRGCRVV